MGWFATINQKDIHTADLLQQRARIFEFLDEVKEKELINEDFYSHFLLGGKEWIDTYTTILNTSSTLTESGEDMKKMIWETTIHTLKNQNKKSTFRETQRNLLSTASHLVALWKERL